MCYKLTIYSVCVHVYLYPYVKCMYVVISRAYYTRNLNRTQRIYRKSSYVARTLILSPTDRGRKRERDRLSLTLWLSIWRQCRCRSIQTGALILVLDNVTHTSHISHIPKSQSHLLTYCTYLCIQMANQILFNIV